MTLCPYKWFLYFASAWALIYIMVETWMSFAAPPATPEAKAEEKARLLSPGRQRAHDDDDGSDDDDSDDDDDEAVTKAVTKASARPTLPRGHPRISHHSSGAKCPFGFSSSS